jgi:gas vesicle protein
MYGQHHTSHDSGGHAFLSGLLFGAAVGGALGLLFAPRAGAEIRGQIAESAGRVRKQASKTYDKASSVVSDAAGKGRDAWQKGRETFEETRDEFAKDLSS